MKKVKKNAIDSSQPQRGVESGRAIVRTRVKIRAGKVFFSTSTRSVSAICPLLPEEIKLHKQQKQAGRRQTKRGKQFSNFRGVKKKLINESSDFYPLKRVVDKKPEHTRFTRVSNASVREGRQQVEMLRKGIFQPFKSKLQCWLTLKMCLILTYVCVLSASSANKNFRFELNIVETRQLRINRGCE